MRVDPMWGAPRGRNILAPGLCRSLKQGPTPRSYLSKCPLSQQDHVCQSSNPALKLVALYQMSLAQRSCSLIGISPVL